MKFLAWQVLIFSESYMWVFTVMEQHWMSPYVKWGNDGCLELSRSSCSSVVRASNQGCDSCLELWNLFSCSFPLCPELWLQRTVLNVSHDLTAAMLRLSREATVEYMAILVKSRLLNCQNIERESVRIHSKTSLSHGQLLPCLCPFCSRLGS